MHRRDRVGKQHTPVPARVRSGGEKSLVGRLRLLRSRHGRSDGPAVGRVLHRVHREHIARTSAHEHRVQRRVHRPRALREDSARPGAEPDLWPLRSSDRSRAGTSRDRVPRVFTGPHAAAERGMPGSGRDRHGGADSRQRHRQGVPHHDRHAGRRVSDVAVRRRCGGGNRRIAAAADELVVEQLRRGHCVRRRQRRASDPGADGTVDERLRSRCRWDRR
jgi:hypothetical protein